MKEGEHTSDEKSSPEVYSRNDLVLFTRKAPKTIMFSGFLFVKTRGHCPEASSHLMLLFFGVVATHSE